MKRTQIKTLDTNHVMLTTSDGVKHEFWHPPYGGYVRQIDDKHPGTLRSSGE